MSFEISFTPLTHDDLPLIFRWSQAPHLQVWWFKEPHERTMEFVVADFGPAIDGEDPTRQFLIVVDGAPAGFIQTYLLEDWAAYAAYVETPPGSAGLDLFIGESSMTGRGLGPAVIEAFIDAYLRPDPRVTQIVIVPEPENHQAIRCYEKASFTHWKTVQIPGEPVPDYLMVRHLAPEPTPGG